MMKFAHLAFGLLMVSRLAFADNELASMDLEQLMEMNVTTVAKRSQTFSSAAAAIYTITQEDIRRSGATHLPEVLRQSPGIEVARINPGMWAVTARGFNGHGAHKLLVLVDGRSVYTPIFGGVYWDEQVPPLDDIQRIEIIRGPGASLWGSNAVNGVINIITYDSDQTQGLRVTTGAGNEEKGYLRSRYGFRNGNLTGRFNAQSRQADEARIATTGAPANDDYGVYQLGSRFDWRPTTIDKLTLDSGYTETHRHTDIYFPEELRPLLDNPPASIAGELDAEPRSSFGAKTTYLLGSWLHELKNGDSFSVQFFLDSEHRVDPLSESKRFTSDIEVQYNVIPAALHRMTWGFGSRNTKDEIASTFGIYIETPEAEYSRATAFVQDEYNFTEDWTATLGIKIEESSFSNTEHQPSLRVAWQPSASATFWAATSRAVRTPTRLERSFEFRGELGLDIYDQLQSVYPDVIPYQIIQGSEDFDSETLYAYESGVRFQPYSTLFIDFAVFRNRYKNLQTWVPDLNILNLRIFDPVYPYVGWEANLTNGTDAEAEGAELATQFVPQPDWKIKFAYTYYNLAPINDFPNYPAYAFAYQSPQHQAHITSSHTFSSGLECDITVRYVDEISDGFAPAYTTVDARIAKSFSRHFELAIIGKDLFDAQRLEIINRANGPHPTEMERSIYLQASWR